MVVNEEEEVALLKPKYMSEQYYNFVSGYVQPGEAAELCAAREVQEEIGLQARDVHFVCSHWESEQQMLLLGFVARATKGSFTLSEEINAAKWVPVAKALDLVYPEGNITHTLLVQYLHQ